MEMDAQRIQFERFSADLPQDVKTAIWDLLQAQHVEMEPVSQEGQLQIGVESGLACTRVLTLYGVSGVPEGDDACSFESLIKRGNEYLLIGQFWEDETDTERIFTIRFTHAQVQTTVCRAEQTWFDNDTPWEYLVQVAAQIMHKYTISDTLLNEQEKKLLPLLAELTKLCAFREPPEPWNNSGFPALTEQIRDHGFQELLPALDRYEKNYATQRKNMSLRMLLAKLNRVRYEPLFRSIWSQISRSQQDYPTMAELKNAGIKLIGIRRRVQKQMEELGYSGTYPDFYKTGPVKDIRFAESYGLDYLVYLEKNAVFRIHCMERQSDGLELVLVCATQLLKKNQTPGDLVSCLFNSKGRSYYKTVTCWAEQPGQLETVLPIADKLAQLKKLSREDKICLNQPHVSGWAVFLLWLIFGGGFFGLLFTPAMMALDALFCLLDGVPVTFTDFPWLQILLFTWLGFGGIMGAIMALLNKLK